MKLQDRVAIVTGSAQGIGRAVAQKLTDEGAKVVLADINGPGVEQAASELPGALGLTVDVSKRRRRPAHGRRDGQPPRQGRRARQRRRDRAVHRLGRHHVRGVAPHHVGQPRRRLPDDQGRREADARGGLRPHRQHRLERRPGGHAQPRPLRGVEGRRVVLHARRCPRARQVRHHRQLGGARADRVRGRPGEPARRGLRVRADAAGDPAARPCPPTSRRPSPSSPPRRPAG